MAEIHWPDCDPNRHACMKAGILKYFEELKRELNIGFGPKDIFEIASKSC
jgi:hypothetical protein